MPLFRGFCAWLPRVAELRQSVRQEGCAAEAVLICMSRVLVIRGHSSMITFLREVSMSPVVFTRRKVGLSEKVLGV